MYNFLIFISVFSLFVSSPLQAENPENGPLVKGSKKEEILFQRIITDTPPQIVDLSLEVFGVINANPPEVIGFNFDAIAPFDDKGTCSAMALDFAARFATVCEKLKDFKASKERVKKFKPFYEKTNSTFVSRQAAYNTLLILDPEASPHEIRHAKLQALASYHGLILKPETGIVSSKFIKKDSGAFCKIIEKFDDGLYLVRGIFPTDNIKMEVYGHTMVIVKYKNAIICYDNGKAAYAVTKDPWKWVRSKLLTYKFPEFRFYKVSSPKGGCINLSEEES